MHESFLSVCSTVKPAKTIYPGKIAPELKRNRMFEKYQIKFWIHYKEKF